MDEDKRKFLEEEIERQRGFVFHSGILDLAAKLAQVPYQIEDVAENCRWNGKYLLIGNRCDAEEIIHELAYCIIVPVERRKSRSQRDEEELDSPKAMALETRVSLLAIIYLRSLGFDAAEAFDNILDCGRPFRYPFDPNEPFDTDSPYLVWESKTTRTDISKAYKWLDTRGFFNNPFAKRASLEIKFIIDNLIRYRTKPIQPPVSYHHGNYHASIGHPDVRKGELEFDSIVEEEDYRRMQAQAIQTDNNYILPRREEKEGPWGIFYLRMDDNQDPFEEDAPYWHPEELFESEEEAFKWLQKNIKRRKMPSKDWDDYLIVSSDDVTVFGDDDDDVFGDDDEE